MWELKGLFDHAYAQSEAIDFMVENGRYCIHILAVRFYYESFYKDSFFINPELSMIFHLLTD